MEVIRTKGKERYAPSVSGAKPVTNVGRTWVIAGRVSTIGIFLLLFGAFLYVGRAMLVPIVGAMVVATTLAPVIKKARNYGMPPWVSALIVVTLISVLATAAVTAMAGPVSEWIKRAPEIESTIRQALSAIAQPLAAFRSLENSLIGSAGNTVSVSPSPSNVIVPVLAFVTPAAAQLILFLGTLIFALAGEIGWQTALTRMFASRDGKLRFLRIMRDIERSLAGYLLVITIVNAILGCIVSMGAWALGLPNPIIFGMLAAILNYVPYVGPAIMALVLFGVSLVTSSSLIYASIAPLCLLALTGLEGHLITPAIVGRRFTFNPLLVILGLAFWTWLWGPVGAFFAAPFTIVGLVVYHHLFAKSDVMCLD